MYVIACLGKAVRYYKNGWDTNGVVNFTDNVNDAALLDFMKANELVGKFNNELDGTYQVLNVFKSKEEAWFDYFTYSNVSELEADEFKMADIEQAFYDGIDGKEIGDSPYKEYWDAGRGYQSYILGA